MDRFRPLGIRSKLTVSAVAVITVLYLFLGIAVELSVRRAVLGSIDTSLRQSAEGFMHPHHRPPGPDRGPGRPDGPPGPDDHRGPDDRRGPPMDFRNRRGFGPGDEGPRRPPQKAEEPEVHSMRPNLVWRDRDVRVPFPLTKPVDVDATLDARNGKETLRTVYYNGDPVRVFTVPLRDFDNHQIHGVIEINYWLTDIYKTLDGLTGALLLILPIGILLMAGAGTFVVGKTLQPIRDMTATAAKIGAEDLKDRLPVEGKDEFADLAKTINGMFGRLDISFESQKQTLEQLKEVILQQRRFTADASHELKTPLAVVKVNSSLLKPSLKNDPEGLELVQSIDEAVNRMSKLVQDLLLLARTDAGQLAENFVEVDLISTADSAVSLVTCASRIDISAPNEALTIQGSQSSIERLLANLLDNACRHSDPETRILLQISQQDRFADIQVIDRGEGIPAEHLPKIFDRFHRVDGSRHSGTGGAGLGLAICKGIVEAHKGTIAVASELEKGSTFTIRLPLSGS